jgi:hypothetical protein
VVVFCKKIASWWFFEILAPIVVVFCNFLGAEISYRGGGWVTFIFTLFDNMRILVYGTDEVIFFLIGSENAFG